MSNIFKINNIIDNKVEHVYVFVGSNPFSKKDTLNNPEIFSDIEKKKFN